jgi:hypothetical protein
MSRGYVYVLSNVGMPGLCKIGRSIRGGRNRAAELDGTGVPAPFFLEFEMLTDNCEQAEWNIHAALAECRFSESREFFRIEAGDAIRVVVRECCEDMDLGTPEFIDLVDLEIASQDSRIAREDLLELFAITDPANLRAGRARLLRKRRVARKERKLTLVSGAA